MSVRKIRHFFSGTFAFVGVAAFFGALVFAAHTLLFWTRVESAPGVVKELIKRPCPLNAEETCFDPVVTFKGPNKLEYTFRESDAGRVVALEAIAARKGYTEGGAVQVLFQAESPQKARIGDAELLWGMALKLAGIFVVALPIAFVFRPGQGIHREMVEEDRFRR